MNEDRRQMISNGIQNTGLNETKSYAYCMFRNTAPMLEDCITILDECGDVEDTKEYQGEEEERAIDRVIEMACEIAEMYGYMVHEDE